MKPLGEPNFQSLGHGPVPLSGEPIARVGLPACVGDQMIPDLWPELLGAVHHVLQRLRPLNHQDLTGLGGLDLNTLVGI